MIGHYLGVSHIGGLLSWGSHALANECMMKIGKFFFVSLHRIWVRHYEKVHLLKASILIGPRSPYFCASWILGRPPFRWDRQAMSPKNVCSDIPTTPISFPLAACLTPTVAHFSLDHNQQQSVRWPVVLVEHYLSDPVGDKGSAWKRLWCRGGFNHM